MLGLRKPQQVAPYRLQQIVLAAAMLSITLGCRQKERFDLPDDVAWIAALTVSKRSADTVDPQAIRAVTGLLPPTTLLEAKAESDDVVTFVLGYSEEQIRSAGDPTAETLQKGLVRFRPDPLCRGELPEPSWLRAVGEDGTLVETDLLLPPLTTDWAPDRCEEIREVFLGDSHACAMRRSGELACWGSNRYGQVGNGAVVNQPAPALLSVPAMGGCAGASFACVVDDEKSVWCWGNNEEGQLADPAFGIARFPTKVPGISDAVAVACGFKHTCILRTDGTVACWGSNRSKILGRDTQDIYSIEPKVVPGVSDVRQIALGYLHSCVLRDDGQVLCWGLDSKTPSLITGFDDEVQQISAGYGHTCVLTRANTVFCWGQNNTKQLGDGTREDRSVPVRVTGLGAIRQIEVYGDSSCAVGTDGAVSCWGANYTHFGARAPEGSGSPLSFVSIAGHQLVLGKSFACSHDTSAIQCWGSNQVGQLGIDRLPPFGVPVRASGLPADIQEVAFGSFHACARDTAGRLYCWGHNRHGELGDGTLAAVGSDDRAPIDGLSNVVQVTLGTDHSCARKSDGSVQCWGSTKYSQLGYGKTKERIPTPQTVSGVSNVSAMATGRWRTCVITSGEVRCWGGEKLSTTPTRVPGLSSAVSVAVGDEHHCALLGSGRVSCWGSNSDGQLGDGTTDERTVPAEVPDVDDVVEVAAGFRSTCVRHQSGGVSCWGQTGEQSTVAKVVSNIRDAVKIGAARNHACALVSNGVLCWGKNSERAAAGSILDQPLEPQLIPNTASATDIAVGETGSCALLPGEVWCWGTNNVAQLGVREPAIYYEPQSVLEF